MKPKAECVVGATAKSEACETGETILSASCRLLHRLQNLIVNPQVSLRLHLGLKLYRCFAANNPEFPQSDFKLIHYPNSP